MGGETLKILAAKDMSYPVLHVDGLVTSAKYLSKNSGKS